MFRSVARPNYLECWVFVKAVCPANDGELVGAVEASRLELEAKDGGRGESGETA